MKIAWALGTFQSNWFCLGQAHKSMSVEHSREAWGGCSDIFSHADEVLAF